MHIMAEILKVDEKNKEKWSKFLRKKKSRFQHLLSFKKVLEQSYTSCEGEYYCLRGSRKDIKAIFPFMFLKSKLFGNRSISLPFLDVGGFLGDYSINVLKKIIDKLKGEKIEIRLNDSMKDFNKERVILKKAGFSEEGGRQQFIIKLTSEEDMWKKFHKHTRNDIRKAMKSGLEIKKINSFSELKSFYFLYLREMKKFGTPQHSQKFFKNLFDEMADNVIGFNCYKNKFLIGSIVIFFHNGRGYISFNVSDVKYRNFRPNDILYWETIKWALKNNIKELDMGQVESDAPDNSRAKGLYKFKEKWLGKLYNRVYFVYPPRGKEVSKKNKLKKFRKIWMRLPLFVVKIIGPKICSGLGT